VAAQVEGKLLMALLQPLHHRRTVLRAQPEVSAHSRSDTPDNRLSSTAA